MTIKKIILISLIAILFPLAVILINIQVFGFNLAWYYQQFEKQGLYQQLDRPRVQAQTENLNDYFRGRQPLADFYSEREISHLADVKIILEAVPLLAALLVIILTAIIIFLLFHYQTADFIKIFAYSNTVSLVIYGVLLVLLALYFDRIFSIFHQLAFNNNFWMLDPQSESLIVIFKPEFFLSLANRIMVYCLAELGLIEILFGLLIFCSKRSNNQDA